MDTDDEALIVALQEAGHTEMAAALRDKQLAGQLRSAGHDGLAAQLDGTQPAPGMDINKMIAGRQAQVRELAEWAEAQANGGPLPAPRTAAPTSRR